MLSDARVDALLRLLYAAPGSGAAWERFLERVFEITNCATYLIDVDVPSRVAKLPFAAGLSPEMIDDFNGPYAALNPYGRPEVLAKHREGMTVFGEQILPRPEFERSEFYADVIRPRGYLPTCLFTLPVFNRERSAVLSLSRSTWQRESLFHDAFPLMQYLSRHLAAALDLHSRLVDLGAERDAFRELMHDHSSGIATCRSDHFVTFANGKACRIFAANDGLGLRSGKLRAHTDSAQRRLVSALTIGLRLDSGQPGQPAPVVWVPRPSGEPPYRVRLVPAFAHGERRSSSILVVIEDQGDEIRAGEALAHLPRSLRSVAEAAAAGMTDKEIAVHCGLGLATVRTYVSRIYRRLGVTNRVGLRRALYG